MAKRTQYHDVVTYDENGVKVTFCAPREPRKNEKTYDIAKSRYTAWHQGVKNFEKGINGCQGTVAGSDGCA